MSRGKKRPPAGTGGGKDKGQTAKLVSLYVNYSRFLPVLSLQFFRGLLGSGGCNG